MGSVTARLILVEIREGESMRLIRVWSEGSDFDILFVGSLNDITRFVSAVIFVVLEKEVG